MAFRSLLKMRFGDPDWLRQRLETQLRPDRKNFRPPDEGKISVRL
jgi:hypothetical protein